jgi:antitoxin component of MazEF toxin-antitoxin module
MKKKAVPVHRIKRRKRVSAKRRRYTAAELMAKFKPEHRYPAWDVGGPVGKEIW